MFLKRFSTYTLQLVYYKMPVKYSIVKERRKLSAYSYQLSAKTSQPGRAESCSLTADRYLVGLGRIELPTSPLSGVRSSQLSYRPNGVSELVELVGIEPATS